MVVGSGKETGKAPTGVVPGGQSKRGRGTSDGENGDVHASNEKDNAHDEDGDIASEKEQKRMKRKRQKRGESVQEIEEDKISRG